LIALAACVPVSLARPGKDTRSQGFRNLRADHLFDMRPVNIAEQTTPAL